MTQFKHAKILIADIKMDKPKSEDRTFSKEFCATLAQSIESEGLLHDPIVREIADDPKYKYKIISGRNRLYTCAKILGWTEIPVKVAPVGMTDDEAKAVELAENLFRSNLDETQTKKALSDWHDLYVKTHPLSEGKGSAAKVAKVVKAKVAEAEAKGETVDVDQVTAEVAAEAKPFVKVLQEMLKVSPATAGRLARVARNLDSAQIDVLSSHNVTNDTYDRLAALGSKDLIDKAISLIADGMDHAEAIRQSGKPRASRTPKKGGRETAKPTSEMTDDEWLKATCDPLSKSLIKKGPFRRDAILYRRMADTLSRFQTGSKLALQEAKSDDGNGGFFSLVYRTSNVAHPKDWTVCSACSGTGKTKETGKQCNECLGAAYKVKIEG